MKIMQNDFDIYCICYNFHKSTLVVPKIKSSLRTTEVNF